MTPVKILIVEDSDMNRDMLTRRLERRGFEVICAANATEGLARAAADRPDLVLMDIGLPDMPGIEAARRLKAGAATAAIPVLAVTANALAETAAAAEAAGCAGFFTKPVDFERLLAAIYRFNNDLQATKKKHIS